MCIVRLIALALVMFSTAVQADIEVFPSARLLDEQQREVKHYRLVISELKRNKATTFGEQERRLGGQLLRRIWAVEPGFSLTEVQQFFQQQLSDSEVIYQCQGLACGSSHFWANTIFQNGRLVGREQNQHYWVAKQVREDGSQQVWVVYLVQRGSKQVYIAMDQLLTEDEVSLQQATRKQIQTALLHNGGWLPGLTVDQGLLQESLSDNLIQVLKALPVRDKRRLYLVMHCYDASLMADNMLCSERLAKQLKVATFDGVTELNIIGQGALVTAPDNGLVPRLRYIFWPQR